ncbi:MAG: MarR family transcriptional regulator [Cyanophyceae cyanobacterium]
MMPDRIDHILEQWQRELPSVDVSPLAVVGRVLRIARLLEKRRETLLAGYGLSVWSFDVLATLRRQGPPYRLKPTDLYGLLMLSSGAMTNRIDRLEQEGLVVRLRDAGDRRSVIVELTQKGIDLAEMVMPVLFERERDLLARFAQGEELTAIAPLLRRFLLSLEEST